MVKMNKRKNTTLYTHVKIKVVVCCFISLNKRTSEASVHIQTRIIIFFNKDTFCECLMKLITINIATW